jgi:hypothetical protein
MLHQPISQWCTDHRTAAKSHDGHAGCHAAPVGEPLDEGRDWRNVAESQADVAERSAEPHDPQLVLRNTERHDQDTAAPAEGGHDAGLAWTDPLEPATPQSGR